MRKESSKKKQIPIKKVKITHVASKPNVSTFPFLKFKLFLLLIVNVIF